MQRKTCHAPNTATLQHDSSTSRLSPNRANGVAVFEDSSIRYNTAALCSKTFHVKVKVKPPSYT